MCVQTDAGSVTVAGTPRAITELRIRRGQDRVTIPAFDAICTLRLSTAPHAARRISDTFADNTGSDVATVLSRRRLAFPENVPPKDNSLPPFAYVLPTDRPYLFAARGPLCVELSVDSHTNRTGFRFDLYQEGLAHVAHLGTACGGLDLTTTLSSTLVKHEATGLPPDGPLFFLAGSPLPKPIDLTPLGAPGCQQSITLPIIVPDFATSSGTYTAEFDATLAQPGLFYATQIMAIQPGINALGAVLTQADLVLPITARIAGRVWAESLTAPRGTAQPVFALVMEIR